MTAPMTQHDTGASEAGEGYITGGVRDGSTLLPSPITDQALGWIKRCARASQMLREWNNFGKTGPEDGVPDIMK